MLATLIIGVLLLPQSFSTVGRYDGPLKSLFYHTNACDTQVGSPLHLSVFVFLYHHLTTDVTIKYDENY